MPLYLSITPLARYYGYKISVIRRGSYRDSVSKVYVDGDSMFILI